MRGLLRGFVGFLLNLALIALLITYAAYVVTGYESFRMIVESFLLEQQLPSMDIDINSSLEYAKLACAQGLITEVPITQNISLSCDEIQMLSAENATSYFVNKLAKEVYENGACSYMNCTEEQRLVLDFFSRKGNEKIRAYFTYSLVASVILAFLFMILTKGLGAKFRGLGYVLITASLPVIAMFYLTEYLEKMLNLPVITGNPVIAQITAQIIKLPFYMLIAGIILVAIGFVLRRKS